MADYTNKIDIEIVPYYIIGKGYALNVNGDAPPKLILMLPIKQDEEDITKAFRLLMYQCENYWALYSVGTISKVPLDIVYHGCIYDRISGKGYSAADGAERMVHYLRERPFYQEISILKAIYAEGNPKVRTFASYLRRNMPERSFRRAWFAARMMSEVCRPSELSAKIDNRVAEIYRQCKEKAEEEDITLQSSRNTKE